MSVGLYLVTSVPLPRREEGWSLAVGPVSIEETTVEDLADDDCDIRERMRGAGVGSDANVLHFSSRAVAYSYLDALATAAADALGGIVMDEELEVVASFAPKAAVPNADDIVRRLLSRYEQLRSEEASQLQRAAEQFRARMANDPGLQADNDWSDVVPTLSAAPKRRIFRK